MWNRLRERVTFANVVALCALFVALGSGAYAALKLEANSVRSKHIVNNQVKTKDVADPKFKPVGLVNGWVDTGNPNLFAPGYAVDAEGFVHLRGAADGSTSSGPHAFTLPPAARPGHHVAMPAWASGPSTAFVQVFEDGDVRIAGPDVRLDGIVFPAK